MHLFSASVGIYCINGSREKEVNWIWSACTNTSVVNGNPEFLRHAAGSRRGLRSTGWGPGLGGRRAAAQRRRSAWAHRIGPEFKENCWELWAELKPVISPSPHCLIATLSGLFLMIGFIWLPLEGRGAVASGPAARTYLHFPQRLLLCHL